MEVFGGFAKSYFSETRGLISPGVAYTRLRGKERIATQAMFFKTFHCKTEPIYRADMFFKYDMYCNTPICQREQPSRQKL